MTTTNKGIPFFVKSGPRYRRATPAEVCEAASGYIMNQAAQTRPNLSSPKAAKDFLMMQGGLDAEQFGVLYLDKRHRLLKSEIVFQGTIDVAIAHPREIVKRALQESAAAVIVFHNHPSGNAEPSQADELITHRLRDALALIDVRLLDHLIIANTTVCSLAERGLL